MALIGVPVAGETASKTYDVYSARPRSGVHELGPIMMVGGLVLAFVGFVDLALPYLRPHFGSASWEFFTISQTFEGVPLPLLGLVMLTLGARASESSVGLRALSWIFITGSIVSVVLLMLFALDVPVLLTSLRASDTPDISSRQLWRDTGKTLVFGLCYIVSGLWLATVARRGARQIETK